MYSIKYIIFYLCINKAVSLYNPFPKITKHNYYNYGELSHIDKQNLANLEKIFYQKHNRYSPYKRANDTLKHKELNQHNITEIINNINNQLYKNYDKKFKNNNLENLEDLEDLNDNGLDSNDFDDNDNNNSNNNSNNDNNLDDNDEQNYRKRDPFNLYKSNNRNMYYRPDGVASSNKGSNDEEYYFEVIKGSEYNFKNVGGYDKIKDELLQTADLLLNTKKYKKYNLRVPKGIIFEGPPGNGKTLLAKAFSGELNVSFIPVSGSEFSDKYVGVGASRLRDLFKTANKNKPCIIFIDEIDALARKRGNDMVNSNSEKDQTLNQLLVNLDGFKNSDGVFVIGATNRVDLLDPALLRPGRIDKNIFIGNPDSSTRKHILKIHLKGKPMNDIPLDYVVEMTGGFSGAQIENLINEAMLHALRDNRESITMYDLEYIVNRIMAGWQSTENKYSDDIINRIIIHEMGHALIGFLSNDHSHLVKVTLNLWSPKTPGYTIFESNDQDANIYTKNGLFSHLMVLLGGRVAEEIFYGYSVTTGAKKDLEQAFSLAQNMILNYGMGEKNIYPDMSDQSKYLIDQEINKILIEAHDDAYNILNSMKDLILSCSEVLKNNNILKPNDIIRIIDDKYPEIWDIYDIKNNYK